MLTSVVILDDVLLRLDAGEEKSAKDIVLLNGHNSKMNSVFADDKTRKAKTEVTAAQLETDAADFKDGLDQEKRD